MIRNRGAAWAFVALFGVVGLASWLSLSLPQSNHHSPIAMIEPRLPKIKISPLTMWRWRSLSDISSMTIMAR